MSFAVRNLRTRSQFSWTARSLFAAGGLRKKPLPDGWQPMNERPAFAPSARGSQVIVSSRSHDEIAVTTAPSSVRLVGSSEGFITQFVIDTWTIASPGHC